MNQNNITLKNSSHLNIGKNNKVAFVFSCPGKSEIGQGKPVSGSTGVNLDTLIQILRNEYNLLSFFDSSCRYDYRITNASSSLHYKKFDKRTEPTCSELQQECNLSRLKNELCGFNVIIAFGNKAVCAVKMAIPSKKIKLIETIHLSFQSINNKISRDINGQCICKGKNKVECQNNTHKRLTVIANHINQALNDKL